VSIAGLAASPLRRAALVAVATHAAAGLVSGAFLVPGTPAVALDSRLAYVAAGGWGWRLAWLSWIAAGAAFVWLATVARRCLPGDRLATLAVVGGAAALAVDLPCDLAQAWIQPRLASATDPAAFLATERWLVLGGYSAANGLYSLATLLLTWAVARRVEGGRGLLVTGLPLVAVGLWLAAAGGVGAHGSAVVAAAATVLLCLPWPLHLAHVLEPTRPNRRGGDLV
jgi:hypothetical protein